jgi:hypothetical protein
VHVVAVTPGPVEAVRGEDLLQEHQPTLGVVGHAVLDRVEARLVPARVLHEHQLVAESPELQQVVQLVPGVEAERMADDEARDDDLHRRVLVASSDDGQPA